MNILCLDWNSRMYYLILRFQIPFVKDMVFEENFKLFDFTISDEDVAVLDGFDRPDGRLIVPLLDGKPRDAGHPHYPFNIEF